MNTEWLGYAAAALAAVILAFKFKYR